MQGGLARPGTAQPRTRQRDPSPIWQRSPSPEALRNVARVHTSTCYDGDFLVAGAQKRDTFGRPQQQQSPRQSPPRGAAGKGWGALRDDLGAEDREVQILTREVERQQMEAAEEQGRGTQPTRAGAVHKGASDGEEICRGAMQCMLYGSVRGMP